MKWYRVKAVVIEHLFHLRHSIEDLIDTFFWPVMDVIIWGFMTMYFNRLSGAVAGLVAFLLGGLILWNIVWRAQQDISLSLLRDVWSRNLINLFSTPLTPWEFLVGSMLLGLIKIILTLLLVGGIAFVFYSFNLFVLGFYLIPFFIGLLFFAWVAGLFITALIIRFGMRIQSFAWSLIVLTQPLSCVFYPLNSLPSWMQKIAWFLPTTHIFEGMREVLRIQTLSVEHLVWAFFLDILYLSLALGFFHFMFERARVLGRLAKLEE